MRLDFSPHFLRSYNKAPLAVQWAFDKKSLLLLENLRHPSLHAKKYDESRDLWQARINKDWRFYFSIEDDVYRLHDIIAHPK
jgi:plasmid maintenance system killer protein